MMTLATISGGGTGEILDILAEPGLHMVLSAQSRSATADAATAVRVASLLYGPMTTTVRAHIDANTDLAEFLVAAYAPLVTIFEPGVRCSADLFFDPESPNMSPVLMIGIHTALPVDEAVERLTAFDQDWFLEQSHSIGGRVNFNLEFV